MTKKIEYSNNARLKLTQGINKLADAVTSTLGPNGRNVVYRDESGEVRSTKDGVTVAKNVVLSDPDQSIAVDMVKQAAIRTAGAAGDGTTTSTLLTQHIINKAQSFLEQGANAVQIKRDIDEGVKEIVKALKENVAEEITSEEQLIQVASISANNDSEIGNLITSALDAVGRDGIVTIEESRTGETYLETVEGIQFDRGYKSPYFVNDNSTMAAVLDNPYILIYDGKITQAKEMLPVLEAVSSENKSLLVIAEDIDSEALATLIVNKMRGTLKVAAVKAPDFGDRRKLILDDIAVMTGGTVVSSEKGMKLTRFDWNWFGKARKANVQKESTTIIDGAGAEDKVNDRIEELKTQIDNSRTPFEQEKLQERLGKLTGGVSIIHVGGNSEIEMKEKKDRVEDALYATRAAIDEGIVPGGGAALIHARSNFEIGSSYGRQIVYTACGEPLKKILTNAGYDNNEVQEIKASLKGTDSWTGYDLKAENTTDMKEAGIIDPLKVTRTALENAASVAGTVLLTECIIADDPDAKSSDDVDEMSKQMMFG